jgi:hypothetical protein
MYLQQPMGGTWDNIVSTVKGGARTAINFYGQAQRDAGASAALQAQIAAQQAAQQPRASGITPTHLAVGGAALVALVLLLRK